MGRTITGDGHTILTILARLCDGQGAAGVGATIETAAAPGIGAPDPDGGRRRLFHDHGARGSLFRRRLKPSRGDVVCTVYCVNN